jgi:hypothetical protein
MKKLASSLMLLMLCAGASLAQTAPDAAELTKMLNDFLAGASRNDPVVHERFWADDLIYTRSAGRRTTKAEIMRDLRSAPAPKPSDPKTVYTAEDILIQQYGSMAIVAFRLVSTTETGGTKQVANNMNSGTFLKRNGKWQVIGWQSTRMPRTEENSKTEVTAVETAFHDAIVAADTERITALTDPTFVWTGLSGQQMNREKLLEGLRAGTLTYKKPVSTGTSLYGDTAIARGEWRTPTLISYTLTLINQAGTWKAVAMQISGSD